MELNDLMIAKLTTKYRPLADYCLAHYNSVARPVPVKSKLGIFEVSVAKPGRNYKKIVSYRANFNDDQYIEISITTNRKTVNSNHVKDGITVRATMYNRTGERSWSFGEIGHFKV